MAASNTVQARTQPAPQAPDNAADMSAVGALIPFVRGALKCQEIGVAIQSTLGSSSVNQQHVLPMVNGWDRHWLLKVVVASSGNSATVALGADAPYALLGQIQKNDNRQQLLYQLRGYDARIADRFGGYHVFDPEDDTNSFTALTTGAGATAGSGSFIIPIPDEFGREGWGSWPNMDSSQRRTINLSLSALSNTALFSTPPNGTVVVTVTPICVYYARPPAINADGLAVADRPDMAGSISYWREEVVVLASGDNVVTLRQTGRNIRNLFLLFTDASDVRSNTVKPTTMRAEIDNQKMFDCDFASISGEMFARFGEVLPTGLFPGIVGTLAPDGVQGNEYPDGYVQTSNGSQIVLKFTTGAAGKLYAIYNEVVLAGPLPANL